MAPKDEAELRDMLLTAIEYNGPAALRYPRGNGVGVDISSSPKKLEIGKAEILIEDPSADITILAYGSMVYPSLQASENLRKSGIRTSVVNARFAKPLDAELILALAQSNRLLVTVEEAYLAGGFGSAVMELLEENELIDSIKVLRIGLPDRIITHGDPKLLLAKYGLDADGIYNRIRQKIEAMQERRLSRKNIRFI
jgi:1-deoxy-D-xylulose-5-phosphate synthase